jgi:hypothetical protein
MRVAVCISGAPRLTGNALTYFARSLPEGVEIDYFGYFWEGDYTDEAELKAALEAKMERRTGDVFVRIGRGFVPDLNFQHTVYPETNRENLMRMYAAIRRANDMKIVRELEGRFTYDVVVRHRADVATATELDFAKLVKICEDFIVVPDNGHFRGGLNDQFAMSSSRNMDVYSQVFDYIKQHCLNGCILHPESLLRFHLMRMRQIPIQAPLNTAIVRD